jgi:hypothetical protein
MRQPDEEVNDWIAHDWIDFRQLPGLPGNLVSPLSASPESSRFSVENIQVFTAIDLAQHAQLLRVKSLTCEPPKGRITFRESGGEKFLTLNAP